MLYFILEETDERQIISNLAKVDADKNYCDIEITDVDTAEISKQFLMKKHAKG